MKMSICSLVMVVAVVLSAHCAEEENGHGTFYSPVGVSWLGWDIPTEWVPSNSVDGRSDVAGLGLVVFPFGVCGDVHGLQLNTALYGGQRGRPSVARFCRCLMRGGDYGHSVLA